MPAFLWSLYAALSVWSPFACALFWLLTSATYVSLEPLSGAAAAVLYGAVAFHAQRFVAASPDSALSTAGRIALGAAVLQVVVGHGLLERKRPAFTQSLVEALVIGE